jgi:pyridoxal phosphate enzyme (YggS family)
MDAAENIKRLKQSIPERIRIVAVSKTVAESDILAVYQSGHKLFGENRVQELLKKKASLPDDIEWHMIGHLQSNKVKYIVPFISMIHSVDNLHLLSVINQEALKCRRLIDCLLQIKIAKEETKFGLDFKEALNLLKSSDYAGMKNIRIKGLMGMATFTENDEIVRSEFRYLAHCFNTIKSEFFPSDSGFCELSMGMTGDYKIAVEEGSTILRIGTLIFGSRSQANN